MIITYELVQKVGPDVHRYGVVVADESHNLKNSNAKRTQFMSDVVNRAKRAILLTGTPLLNRPIEAFSQVGGAGHDYWVGVVGGVRGGRGGRGGIMHVTVFVLMLAAA